MDDLAKLGMLLSCVLAIYVGSRTLWIARRTRHFAEFSIGVNVLSIAAGALILTSIGALGKTNPAVPTLPHVLGLLGLALHVSALFIGTWKIFRPATRWPIAAIVAVHALLGVWIWAVMLGPFSDRTAPLLFQTLRGVGMAWAAFECLRYSGMLKKRAALGMADPMIAHRIWLWGVGASVSLAYTCVECWSWMQVGQALAHSPIGLHVTSGVGLIGTVAIALAFFPPSAYTRLIERSRASAAEVA